VSKTLDKASTPLTGSAPTAVPCARVASRLQKRFGVCAGLCPILLHEPRNVQSRSKKPMQPLPQQMKGTWLLASIPTNLKQHFVYCLLLIRSSIQSLQNPLTIPQRLHLRREWTDGINHFSPQLAWRHPKQCSHHMMTELVACK